MTTVHVGVRVPDSLYEKLSDHAQHSNLSRSEVILSALAQYLKSTEDVPLAARVNEIEKRLAEVENWHS